MVKPLFLGYALAVFAVLLPANVLYLYIRRPDVGASATAINLAIRHFGEHDDCEDVSDSCAAWASAGMCRWDRTAQRLCRSSCDRCGAPASEAAHAVPSSLALPELSYVTGAMARKVAAALASPALAKALKLVGQLNGARLAESQIDPRTCQHSDAHGPGQALLHDFLGSLSSAASIQDACRFDLLPVAPHQHANCSDARPGCVASDSACRGADFADAVRTCAKTCGFCDGGCANKDAARCPQWAASHQCEQNAGFMLDACPASCGLCRQLHDPRPPSFVVLWNGLLMPSVGFGTAGLGGGTQAAVAAALRVGYRHIDSAQAPEWYREDLNAQALLASGVARDKVFITSKVHPRDLGYNATMRAVATTLQAFATECIDLMLLHYPSCWGSLCGEGFRPEGSWRESWRALEQLVQEGRVLSLGVSNFGVEELLQLLEWAVIPPAVVQRNSDLFSQDRVMHRLCLALGIRYEAYSSLGTQYMSRGYAASPVLSHPGVRAIAQAHGCTPAQVVLTYALTMGQVVLPRSSKESHMKEALDLLHTRRIVLEASELVFLASLEGHLPSV